MQFNVELSKKKPMFLRPYWIRSSCGAKTCQIKTTIRDPIEDAQSATLIKGVIVIPAFLRIPATPNIRAAVPAKAAPFQNVRVPLSGVTDSRSCESKTTPNTMRKVPIKINAEGRSPKMGIAIITTTRGEEPTIDVERESPIRLTPM
jgi:hypothetical protein